MHTIRTTSRATGRTATLLRHGSVLAVSARRPVRLFSATATTSGPRIRNGTLFVILAGVGVVFTAYGIYDIYSSMTRWPEELRSDLRAGMLARRRKDPTTAAKYFQRALESARALPPERFERVHWMISGLELALADTFEEANDTLSARTILQNCLTELRAAASRDELDGRERMRAAAVAARLADDSAPEDEESLRVFAAEETLRALGADRRTTAPGADPLELDLPRWATTNDIAAPLEGLGSFYARKRKLGYAVILYARAIQILEKADNAEERCRAAQLWNNLAELSVRAPTGTPDAASIARSHDFAAKGLQAVAGARKLLSRGASEPTCDQACATLFYNVGFLHEMQGEDDKAQINYELAFRQAEQAGFSEGVREAGAALLKMRMRADSKEIGARAKIAQP